MRICFRAGVSIGEIRAVIDHAAVREAEQYLIDAGKKPTYSNISIITGFARHTVRALRETDDFSLAPRRDSQLDRAVRVLNGWHEDDEFLDASGNPRELRVRGGTRSFEILSQRYAGGVGFSAVLERLLETKAVRVVQRDSNGRALKVRAIQSNPEPEITKARHFAEFGEIYGDAIDSYDAFLRQPSGQHENRVYTVSTTISAPKVRLIGRLLRDRGEATVASVDALLKRHELPLSDQKTAPASACANQFDVRVSLVTTIRAQHEAARVVDKAWRRQKEVQPVVKKK
jgi:hypothetical protein